MILLGYVVWVLEYVVCSIDGFLGLSVVFTVV